VEEPRRGSVRLAGLLRAWSRFPRTGPQSPFRPRSGWAPGRAPV